MNFTQTCSIAKRTGSASALNERTTEHGAPTSGIACLYAKNTHKKVNEREAQLVQVAEEMFFFPIGTDVSKGDEISDVLFANGDLVTTKKFIVETALERVVPVRGRVHVEAQVRSLS